MSGAGAFSSSNVDTAITTKAVLLTVRRYRECSTGTFSHCQDNSQVRKISHAARIADEPRKITAHATQMAAVPLAFASVESCRQLDQNHNRVNVNQLKVRPRAKTL